MSCNELETLFAEGNNRFAAGDLVAAEACFRQALALAPEEAALRANLALLLEQRGKDGQAEIHYLQALHYDHANPAIRLNYFAQLLRQKQLEQAEVQALQALTQEPESARCWTALGLVHACRQHDDEAESCYRTALALDPDYTYARFNLAYVLLRHGRMAEGWECLDARNGPDCLQIAIGRPRWQGEALAGKTILIAGEAGQGDMIQFCRYANELKARGAVRVAVQCQPALKPLLATLAAADDIIALDETITPNAWDYWSPALSLPRHCTTRLDNIPAALPYLHAPQERHRNWHLPDNGLRVGMVWRGNPRFENDADRSLPLTAFAPLADLAGIHFISLQKGAGEDEQPPAGLHLHRPVAPLNDFADTAALIEALDLVIAVDTAVAHLAGALGKRCWVLLPHYKTDWRWLTERNDSPWYPGVVRLFRQPKDGDWPSVMLQIKQALLTIGTDRHRQADPHRD